MALSLPIEISDIKTALGTSENSFIGLCTHSNLNIWSKRRPGYWFVDSSETPHKIAFRRMRGSDYTDPRGLRDNTDDGKEWYRLYDFNGYKTLTESPAGFVDGSLTLNLTINEGSSDLSARTYSLDLGEVDWFGEESDFNAKNYLNHTIYKICLCYIDDNDNLVQLSNSNGDSEYIVPSGGISGQRKTANVPMYVPTPSAVGVSKLYRVHPCFADANDNIWGYFDTIYKDVTITKVSYPYIVIAMDTEAGVGDTIFSNLLGVSSDDNTLYGIECGLDDNRLIGTYGSGDTITFSASDLSFFRMISYPSYTYYGITSPRWTYYYKIYIYNALGEVIASDDTGSLTYRAAVTGHLPALQFTLPSMPSAHPNLIHGDFVRVYICNCASTNVEEIQI